MATTVNLKIIQQYPEFKSSFLIQMVKEFIHSVVSHNQFKNYPPNFTARQMRSWNKKFSKNYVVENNKLYYRPSIQPSPNQGEQYRINLEVLPPDQHQEKLEDIYHDITKGQGIGWIYFIIKYVPNTSESQEMKQDNF